MTIIQKKALQIASVHLHIDHLNVGFLPLFSEPKSSQRGLAGFVGRSIGEPLGFAEASVSAKPMPFRR